MLTPQTRANYRVQCRRLWEIYKLMGDYDERKPALKAQIERLCDKLGYELDRLDVILYTSLRGRPRINPDVSDIAAQIKSTKEDPLHWTPEAIERRAKARVDESAQKLDEMLKLDQAKAHEEAIEQNRLVQQANEALVTTGGDNVTRSGDSSNQPGTLDVEREPGSGS
jgi:hypothetical protein